jgi:hypothetical protein
MVVMTVVMGLGLAWVVALDDPRMGVQVGALTVLGMAATYGVVCGAMMIAGEHEGGTLVYLDIFLGRRWLLWLGKFGVGVVLVVAEAAAVSLALYLLRHEAPDWAMRLVGKHHAAPSATVWIWILPTVSLCGFAFGLLGSSMTQKVLAGATVAAVGVTPVWLLSLMAPPFVFFALQIFVATIVLIISCVVFLSQARETAHSEAPPEPDHRRNPKDQFLELWEEFEREDEMVDEYVERETPVVVPVAEPVPSLDRPAFQTNPPLRESRPGKHADAGSPFVVLWWLTLVQAAPVLWGLAIAALLAGLILSANSQLLWPALTLLFGVACGTATFAPEQRDLSYQFLSSQHFPHKTIWRFKVGFWLIVALLATLIILFVHYFLVSVRAAVGNAGNHLIEGSLSRLLGPTLFLGIWLAYGFCSAQIVVWLCRKTILALLVSLLVAAGSLLAWLPSLLCGGMQSWPVWAPPIGMMVASWCLMRAWASGRLRERKPLWALVGFISVGVLWLLLIFGYRAFHVTNVGMPIDPLAFRESMPINEENAGAKAIHDSVNRIDEWNKPWLATIKDVHRLPTGVLEIPRKDGSQPNLGHLAGCRKLTDMLLEEAKKKEPGPALEHLAQILALSRNLRNRAPVQSCIVGIHAEEDALEGLNRWLARGKPTPKLLRQALDELNRHAKETPPPRSCLEAESYRSFGALDAPTTWSFKQRGAAERIEEPWLAGGIAVSLEMPWEAERNARIWQLVWAGLFRAVETPHWELPATIEELHTEKAATATILRPWLAAADGSGMTRAQLARLMDASWIVDERLFCDVSRLRGAATRSRWRVDAARQALALSLYQLEQGKPAQALQDLVPKYLPELPVDPYSGKSFLYSAERRQLWSTGPDRIDHGGRNHGGHLPDDAQWQRGEFDLITPVPHWP